MFNDAPAKFSFIKYANYSVQTCNVMVAPEWKSNISGLNCDSYLVGIVNGSRTIKLPVVSDVNRK
jgi:hypothetical protein